MDPGREPALDLLLGPEAPDLVQVALQAHGGRLRSLRAVTVDVAPDGGALVQYAAEVGLDGGVARETLAATTGTRIPDGATVLTGEVGGRTVRVGLWRWPNDPGLPALADASDPHRLAGRLAGLGVPTAGPLTVAVRAYRPGRRAVLEVTGGGARLFVKVVRPTRVAALRARHDLLAPHVPTPPAAASSPDGLLVLAALPGAPLRTPLDAGAPVPDGPALDALLDRLPAAVADLPQRRRPGDHLARVPRFAAVLARTAVTGPADRRELDALVDRLTATDPGVHADVPVHGDLYESQLLVDGPRVTGLLDVDTAGCGHRVDEWANLLGHLSVLGHAPAQRYGAALLAHAERRFAPAQLRPRIAAAVLGLATGPHRTQQPGWADHTARRLRLARAWLDGVAA